MSGRWLWLAGLLVLGSLNRIDVSAGENSARMPAPRWLSDWEGGRKVARATGKPLFVVFRCEH